MTTTIAGTAVNCSIVVDAPQERAFRVFTEEFNTWWPRSHHILPVDVADQIFETRVGGNVYDLGVDGSRCNWGTVVVYEPPSRLVIRWNISLQWQLETDPSKASEIEVRFIPEGAKRTRVELEHRHLDRHGEGWEQMRSAVSSDGGWGTILGGFVERVAA